MHMSTYSQLCSEMGARGDYLTDEIGKCQRHIHAFQGTGRSRIDKYLFESVTYAASLAKRPLSDEFEPTNAVDGTLVWIESRKSGMKSRFPVQVDERNGIVKQPQRERYGLLEDVIDCLFKARQDGTLIPWAEAKTDLGEEWRAHSQEEIEKSDDTLTTFGTDAGSSRRFWQADWRKRVEVIWGDRCLITGCRDRRLLRAAHIKRVCEATTKERLDGYNGLMIAGHLDLAFEHGLISRS